MAGTQFNFEVFNWIGANQSLLSTSYLLILSTKSEIFCRYFLKCFTELFFHNSNFPWWLWWAMPDRYVKNFCQQGRNYVNQFGNKGTSHTKWMQWHSEFWKLLILKFFMIDQREQEISTEISANLWRIWTKVCRWCDVWWWSGMFCSENRKLQPSFLTRWWPWKALQWLKLKCRWTCLTLICAHIKVGLAWKTLMLMKPLLLMLLCQ